MAVKTLIIGLDGADHRMMDQMIAEGALPAFAALRGRSAVFEVENDPAQGNGQFWTSAAVGAGPGHHGRYFYMQFDPASYDIRLEKDLTLPKLTPFWETLDAEGHKVAVVDWYKMPAAPLKHGVLMHRWFAHEPLQHTTFHPPEMRAVAERYANSDPIAEGFASRARDGAAAMRDFFERTLSRIDIKSSFFADQMRDNDWNLYVACFSEAHNIGHYFMEVEDDTHDLHDPSVAAAIPNPLRQCYKRLDRAIGAIIDAAGSDTEIFVIAGPHMEKFISANGAFEEILRRVDQGYAAPLAAAESAKNSYHAIAPEALRRRLAPLAKWMRRKLARNRFQGRRFFAVPHNDNSGAVRINLKGREKYGCVSPGAEYDALIAEITEGVSSFINPATGRSIVKRVVDVSAEFDGPHRHLLPDLFIEWDRTETTGNFQRLTSTQFGEVIVPRHARTGDHGQTGGFWAPAGRLDSAPARPKDLAAPILASVRSAPPLC